MKKFTCPICGGQLEIKIGSGAANCDSCGRMSKIDPEDAKEVSEIYYGAIRTMRQNTAAGYEDAIRQLRPIAFIKEAQEKIKYCETRLSEKQAAKQRSQEAQTRSEKKNAWLGIVLLIVTLLLCAAAVAGIVYLIIRLVQGTLSKGAIIMIAVFVAAAIVISLIGKGRSSGGSGSDS